MARTLTEEDIIDYGKYKGTKLKNIPASYLLWVYDNDRATPEIRRYVKQNYMELWQKSREK